MKSPAMQPTGRTPVLYAEYARMLVTVHALLVGLVCLCAGGPLTLTIVGITGAAWVALRASSALNWHWFFPVVTFVMLGLMTAIARQHADWTLAGYGLFCWRVGMALLALMSCVDVTEMITKLYRRLATPDRRARVHAGLMTHGLQFLKWGTIGLILAYSILVPLIGELVYVLSSSARGTTAELDRLSPVQNVLFCFCEAMTGLWFFVIGCCVGSFLNVVIYRVPAGISVLMKSSHCPTCSEEIQSRDNLPLIGWLKLQGRCRNCGTEISSRYPAIELTTGLLFLILYFVQLISGGANLPGRVPNTYVGVLWILFYTKWDLVGLYLFHCFVMCALLCWTMMQRDGNRIPIRAVATTFVIAVAAVLIWPHLLPFAHGANPRPYLGAVDWAERVQIIWPMLKGAIGGLLAGVVLQKVVRIPHHPFSWALAGVALGWQSIVVIGLLCVVVKAVLSLIGMMSSRDSSGNRTVDHSDGKTTDDTDQTTVSPTTMSELRPVVAVTWWWLFPTVVLVHHCLWRHLTIMS